MFLSPPAYTSSMSQDSKRPLRHSLTRVKPLGVSLLRSFTLTAASGTFFSRSTVCIFMRFSVAPSISRMSFSTVSVIGLLVPSNEPFTACIRALGPFPMPTSADFGRTCDSVFLVAYHSLSHIFSFSSSLYASEPVSFAIARCLMPQ